MYHRSSRSLISAFNHRPSPLDHHCSSELLSKLCPHAKKLFFFMYEFKLILIYLGNHVSSLSKLIHIIKVFSIPSGCFGRFVPVVYNKKYMCHLYESRAMNFSTAEKECSNLGADLVDCTNDFVEIQILVRLTGLYYNSTLLIFMI